MERGAYEVVILDASEAAAHPSGGDGLPMLAIVRPESSLSVRPLEEDAEVQVSKL